MQMIDRETFNRDLDLLYQNLVTLHDWYLKLAEEGKAEYGEWATVAFEVVTLSPKLDPFGS